MESVTLTAPDISCDHCRKSVETALGTLAGVRSVSVDVPTKAVNVTYDASEVALRTIVARLDQEGYPIAG
jgi:copper chaperone